ncbi:MAG TPA: hypothetical protein VMV92_22845 [Streptosporangiaceae bacterium]|nr:hypothetical protein [Streptosporangiaceae bacterium]
MMIDVNDSSGPSFPDLQPARPCVYLDQWVWIRLARAANGKPREASDLRVLAAVRDAAADGVAFPLSTTHHIETTKITSPRQRLDLARTMASISHCRTLRSRKVLLRHQMLHATHLSFGRPAFRPQPPEVLGTGVRWAFDGEPGHGVLRGPDGAVVDPATVEGMPEFLRKANQLTEVRMLAGPGDEEIGELRDQYGYRPEAMDEVEASRLEWEASYVDILADHPASKAELRVRLQARELLHEHRAMFQALISEYRINLNREVGYDPARPNKSRRRMVAFADAVPSLRIAVDLKVELFRNASKPWTMNAIHDIDALSMAVPYCHVVVPDREMASLLSRSRTAERHRTQIIAALPHLPDVLPDLANQARNASGDRTGWDWAGPWDGYCLDWSDLVDSAPGRPPAA